MQYLDDLRVVASGVVLPGGGRILADLITTAREREIVVPQALRSPRCSIAAGELAELLAISDAVVRHQRGGVARQRELDELLQNAGGSEVELDPIALADDAWLADALAYYQSLGFFAGGVPSDLSLTDADLNEFRPWEHWPAFERELLARDNCRTVAVPVYPWEMVACCTALMRDLNALARDACAIEVMNVEAHEDPYESRHAFMNEDVVSVDLRIGLFPAARVTFRYAKYALLVSDALVSINDLLARAHVGPRFRLLDDPCGASRIVLVPPWDEECIARERGVDFQKP